MSTIDPFTIHCLATGRAIATVSDDECGNIIDSLGHVPLAEQALHLERLALASMRPSLVWMSVTPQLVDHMRATQPLQLLSYLMNRLYTHVDTDRKTGKPLSHDSWLMARRQRIATWHAIESSGLTPEQVDGMLYVLLRIDSRYSLAKITPPTSVTGMWDSWHTNPAAYLEALWDWHRVLVTAEEADAKRAKFQAEFWSEGNRLTRMGLAKQFEKVTPPSHAKAVRREKVAKLADSLGFLADLEREFAARDRMGVEHPQAPAKPTAPVRMTRFGAQPKKDS